MAWWNPFSRTVTAKETDKINMSTYATTSKQKNTPFAFIAAGIEDIVKDTEGLRSNQDYTNKFDLFDSMLNYDPELNGAVRTISLTANKYRLEGGRNASIRNAIKSLAEEVIDFDDLLINGMRNLMVYGNDISKLVGKSGVGVTQIQSLPISQITILDDRPASTQTDRDNAIMTADKYVLREEGRDEMAF